MTSRQTVLNSSHENKRHIKGLRGSFVLKGAYNVSKQLNVAIFLVGGAVRDFILSSQLGKDFDFVLHGDVENASRVFAERVQGSFFCLDEQRACYRVTIKNKKGGFNIDFSGLKGHGIEEDLKKRDFTINSMAIDVKDIFENDQICIIDPMNGRSDIERGILRAASSRVFDDDPLRLLRAIRISAEANCVIEEKTESAIRRKKKLLVNSSWERIRGELIQILHMPCAWQSILNLNRLGLLEGIFPEASSWKNIGQGTHHEDNLFDHAVRTVEYAEGIVSNLSDYFPHYACQLEAHFGSELYSRVTRKNILKLVAFLHDSGKAETQNLKGEKVTFLEHDRVGAEINSRIARRLKLGNKAKEYISKITRNHMRILSVSKSKDVTKRVMYRFFRDLGLDGIDCLVLSLADNLAKGPRTTSVLTRPILCVIQNLFKYYFECWCNIPKRPLLNGMEIMELFGIPEGKEVGKLLSIIREAEGEGFASTKEEARAFLRSKYAHVLFAKEHHRHA